MMMIISLIPVKYKYSWKQCHNLQETLPKRLTSESEEGN